MQSTAVRLYEEAQCPLVWVSVCLLSCSLDKTRLFEHKCVTDLISTVSGTPVAPLPHFDTQWQSSVYFPRFATATGDTAPSLCFVLGRSNVSSRRHTELSRSSALRQAALIVLGFPSKAYGYPLSKTALVDVVTHPTMDWLNRVRL